jgi:outer membrane protein
MMKQLKTLLIAAVLFVGANQAVNAQAKTAHVDVSEIMGKMPAMLEAQKQLEKLSATYDADYKTMVDEYQARIKKYETEATTVSDKMNEERSKEVQDMQKRIVDFRDNAQKELQKKETDLTKPLVEKVKAAIQKVGKAKGFQYVLNADQLLLADGPNITADVKKDLGF